MDALDGIFEVLGDPVRRQIVGELGRSDRRVGELVAILERPQNVVSYHLAQLRDAGLATAHRSSADGRDVYYRVDVARCADLLAAASSALHPGLGLAPVRSSDVRIAGRPSLLFLCTGNSARSQIAEALAVQRSGGRVRACSAGSHPKPLHPNAVRVLAERGLDISDRTTTLLTRYARRRFDRVITLCDRVREVCPEFPGAPVSAHWSLEDPAASGPDDATTYPAFVRITDDIDERVRSLLADLAATGFGARTDTTTTPAPTTTTATASTRHAIPRGREG